MAEASSSATYVLVTGGAGFIGSHTVLELIKQGYRVVVVDNLCNSSDIPLRRIEELGGLQDNSIPFHKVDLGDLESLRGVFRQYRFSSVIHFAALKAVGESVRKPLNYYRNNITGTLNLLDVMIEFGVKNLVFSSSATVYKADPEGKPLREDNPLGCTNPYGRTKLYMEGIIHDVTDAEHGWNAIMLRYFNPTGAHVSGRMGEDPKQIPNNLMPYVSQVAVGKLKEVHVFGTDYNTRDGTGVRDYIHVMDLAEAHVAALKRLTDNHGYEVFNLGSGTGQSVLEMVDAMSAACGHKIPYVNDPRRPGDVATVICDPSKSAKELGFTVSRDLKTMCEDLWRWQENNPNGYTQE
ncbi:hypothetical protein FBU59_000224 [Linderina macrospora]|uniref:Uncharacterized protein n=1 Tax=Linderina macrospora TaxID=4868 RepID=A0ACC1JHR6_9FUNG|nr:hypothetical protein FBU59_000224 [Linderina macrospora]